jgi:hypothetical protein
MYELKLIRTVKCDKCGRVVETTIDMVPLSTDEQRASIRGLQDLPDGWKTVKGHYYCPDHTIGRAIVVDGEIVKED